jgi:predicted alpha/beta superfamily hydrolase
MEVDANSLAAKIRTTKNNTFKVYYNYLPQEDHATIMHQAVLNAFKLLNPKKQIDYMLLDIPDLE